MAHPIDSTKILSCYREIQQLERGRMPAPRTVELFVTTACNHNCIGCHTLMGEGAYFAPELVNVYQRFGNSTEAIKAFIQSRPKEGIPGRRSMPQFNFTEDELEALAQFLKYASGINTNNWPPNIQG